MLVSNFDQQDIADSSEKHIPPDAFSLTLSHQDFTILRVSSSADQLIGYTREELIGHPLITLIGQDPMKILGSQLDSTSEIQNLKPISCIVCARYSSTGEPKDLIFEDRSFDMTFDVSHGSLVVKFRPSLVTLLDPVPVLVVSIAHLVKKIQMVFKVEDLLTVSTQEMRKMMHVDRVMVYEFKRDGHVKVVAEDKDIGTTSFVGHHYPSSHLSEHARITHGKSSVKIFYDLANDPRLANQATTAKAGNSSLASMRCMSSAHIEFLDTIDVKFCMSVCIIIDEKLWGLIVYHHHLPQSVSHSMRISCELFGNIMSSKLTSILSSIDSQEIRNYRFHMTGVVNSLIGNDNWKEALIRKATNLCQLFHATGLVICFDSQHFLCGDTPTPQQVKLLTAYIVTREPGQIFTCDYLLSSHVPGHTYKDVGSGILAIGLSDSASQDDMVILFRKEIPETLKWVDTSVDSTIIEGHSERWSSIDLEMAQELKRNLLELKLREDHQRVKKEVDMKAFAAEQQATMRALTAEREATARAVIEKQEAHQIASIAKEHRKQQALFIDTICHEIRNPINGITGTIGVLRNHIGSMEHLIQKFDHQIQTSFGDHLKQLRECANDIEECADHQRVIANDVLSLSTLEQEKVRLENNPINLTRVLRQILPPYESILRDKGLTMEIKIFDTEVYILGDQNRIKQIICNLIGNAIKFTSSGFIRISTASHRTVKENERLFEISIEDSGIGMSQEEMDRLFIPYSQANQGISGKYGGTGLGLVISQQLAKLMSGKITIHSEKGVGSAFKLHFTSQVISSEEYLRLSAPVPVIPRVVPADASKVHKILIVEDNRINQKVLTKMLNKEGYNCDVANNGLEALELYRLHQYRIILMDIQMPVMDGLEATSKIRELELDEKWPASYIACISGNAREQHTMEALSAGVNVYLLKPIKSEQLLNVINMIDHRNDSLKHVGTESRV